MDAYVIRRLEGQKIRRSVALRHASFFTFSPFFISELLCLFVFICGFLTLFSLFYFLISVLIK